MTAPSPDARRSLLGLYADRRMLAILLMGFASGLPLLLTTSTLSYWLSKRGVDKTAIGLFALVGLPYALKFVWAPALDLVRVPWLGERLGRRRAWTLVSQAALFVAILALGTVGALLAAHGVKPVLVVQTAAGEHRAETTDPLGELNRLAAAGAVNSFHVERPTLEQVFLHLTGRSLRD